ncbi:hypothetical protein COOONC_13472 [Cooperia oncophora]
MASTTVNLQSDLSHLHEVTPQILKTLGKIGPQNISEIKFAVGRSVQGCYLRLDFLPVPVISVEMPPIRYAEIGVSCCGDFRNSDDTLTTSSIHYEENGSKCDISIQTGRPYVPK